MCFVYLYVATIMFVTFISKAGSLKTKKLCFLTEKTGFEKIRAPTELIDILMNFWNTNKDKAGIEWKSINPYHNMWAEPVYFVDLEDASLGGGNDLRRDVWRLVRPILEEWTGQALSPVTMYGVSIGLHIVLVLSIVLVFYQQNLL